jgi:hypothetical protein
MTNIELRLEQLENGQATLVAFGKTFEAKDIIKNHGLTFTNVATKTGSYVEKVWASKGYDFPASKVEFAELVDVLKADLIKSGFATVIKLGNRIVESLTVK